MAKKNNLHIKYEGKIFSNNTIYTISTRNGRVMRFLSKQGKAFINDLKKECMVATANKKDYPLKGKVRVDLVYFHKGQGCDRDNIGKGIYDAMEGVIYLDDRQVVAGETLKIKSNRNMLYILVQPITENEIKEQADNMLGVSCNAKY